MDKMNEYFTMQDLPRMYQRVRSKVEFSGVPAGTEGRIVERYSMGKGLYGVTIRWNRWDGDTLEDGFSKGDYKLLEEV